MIKRITGENATRNRKKSKEFWYLASVSASKTLATLGENDTQASAQGNTGPTSILFVSA